MDRKLRLLFVVNSFPTVSETFIVNQIIYLIKKDYDVKILSVRYENNFIQDQIMEYKLMDRVYWINTPKSYLKRIIQVFKVFYSAGNKKKYFLRALNPLRHGRAALNLSAFYKVSWILKFQDDFDIVHAHFGPTSEIFFLAKSVGLFKSTKLITSFHGYDMAIKDLEKNKIRYKQLFDNQTILTTNNPYCKSLIQKIKPNYENIHILPVSLDTSFFQPVDKNAGNNFKILFCGRLIKLKGPDIVIEIANELINKRKIKNINFEIIGEGEEKECLKKLIDHYNLKDYINFRGSLRQRDLLQTLQYANLLVLPGITDKHQRAESQGLVIQEAQAMKLPVLVSDAGGMKYGLLPEKSGFILPEGDIKSFSDKIEFLIKNPLLSIQIGEVGRDFVIKNFDIYPLGKRLEQIYKDALITNIY